MLLVRLFPRRRRADASGALDAAMLDVLGREEQILRAGLAVDLQAPILGPADLLRRRPVRDMGDEQRHAGHLGEGDGPVGRFPIARRGMGIEVMFHMGLARLDQPFRQPAHDGVVLGVDHDHGALARRHVEHFQHLVVRKRQAFIGQIDLEGGAAVADERGQVLAQELGRRLTHHQMKGVVDDGLGVRRACDSRRPPRAAIGRAAAWRKG